MSLVNLIPIYSAKPVQIGLNLLETYSLNGISNITLIEEDSA